jgi:CRP/FNR family transcriptional regulator, cyclic AMP receptor protein
LVKDFLRRVSLFVELEDGSLDRLARLAREEHHPAYKLIFREGDPVDAFFVVQEGMVTVYRDEPGRPQQVLARLEQGGFFGEMGLLNDKARRYASARTAAPTVLLRIEKADLIQLLTANPGLELKFRAEVIRRHGMNVSALLGLAGQRDVRIRLGVDAVIEMEDGARLSVQLENLSLGGIGLSGVPVDWQTGHDVRFRIGQPGEPEILNVSGTVTWREGDTVGIAFGPQDAGNATLINRALRRFLSGRR